MQGEREKVGKTIWKPSSVLVLPKETPSSSTLNAILGYSGEGGVCQIRQELMGPRKLLFKTRLKKQKFKQ